MYSVPFSYILEIIICGVLDVYFAYVIILIALIKLVVKVKGLLLRMLRWSLGLDERAVAVWY